jgi:rhodanese-related sulfurtransferase
MRSLNPSEVAGLLAGDGEKPVLLDVRELWELRICSIEGSQCIPMRQIARSLDTLPRDRDIVVICHHGIRSYQVARFLEQRGFSRVINLVGGLAAWARDLDPRMPTY